MSQSQANNQNPLSASEPWNLVADGYAVTTMLSFEQFAYSTFDAAFSLFGLMFFPDRQQGFAEIHRTLKPGGSVAITSWAPVDQSPAMMTMFGALRAIKPNLPQPQRSVTTLENPECFKQEMEEAGFRNVEIRKVTKAFPVGSTVEFWDNMVKGSAPIQMMKKGLGEVLWREKEKLALAWLEETLPPIAHSLSAPVYFK